MISTIRSVVEGRLKSPNATIFALTDFDPDGMAILSTYKHGSISLAHENQNLVIPKMIWIGVNSGIFHGLQREKSQSCLKLTRHDRRKAILMLEKAAFQEEIEPSWRRELQVMLMLNVKAEIQILGGTSSLEDYISNELNSHLPTDSGLGLIAAA
jgi:meiotic recombination protein SPO11